MLKGLIVRILKIIVLLIQRAAPTPRDEIEHARKNCFSMAERQTLKEMAQLGLTGWRKNHCTVALVELARSLPSRACQKSTSESAEETSSPCGVSPESSQLQDCLSQVLWKLLCSGCWWLALKQLPAVQEPVQKHTCIRKEHTFLKHCPSSTLLTKLNVMPANKGKKYLKGSIFFIEQAMKNVFGANRQ